MNNNFDDKLISIPQKMPLLPVRETVIFPFMMLPMFVGRDISIQAIEESLKNNRIIFLATQKEMTEENPGLDSIYTVGTIAMIVRMIKLSDDQVKILVHGVSRGRIKKFNSTYPYFEVEVEKIEEQKQDQSSLIETEAIIRHTKEQVETVVSLSNISPDLLIIFEDKDYKNDPGRIADLITTNIGIKISEAQKVLEQNDPIKRLQFVNEILSKEIEVLQMKAQLNKTTKDEINRNQKEYFLREQLKAIKNELGEMDTKGEEFEDLKGKIISAGMKDSTQKEVLKQLNRLEKMHPDSSEASMLRNYIDTMIELPWQINTNDNLNLKHAQKILNEDHYDLEKVKERILEFLAVRHLKSNTKGPILCFAGPPGVGKTSLGKSIARAMERKYFRMALGGVKDEAEIRGHRRTYVGAMPGKIIQALKQVKSNNPVIVLDEIDKLGSDFRGDPSAAMLEVLDPEQNSTFRDNYINTDFDLSNCLFIATANVLDTIPPALKDRMEIIQLSGYTENDKLLISKRHLISRQIENNGLNENQIEFEDNGLKYLIAHYTRESGVRNLEREIGSLCRKIAKMIVEGKKEKTNINDKKIPELLGAPKFLRDDVLKEPQIGIVTGLAWTQVGGEVLYVEAIKMKGKGGLLLTGQLGDVMKESAQAAMSYARSHSNELGIPNNFFEENEVHIHLPAGAIPKDGPSAGVTLTTSLISLLTNTLVRHDIAMTGEITLSGRVLPVGGIKEKSLAALNQGIKNIIIPLANQKDVLDIPKEFKNKINFIFVETIDEVLAIAFINKSKQKKISTKNTNNKKQKSAVADAA